MLRSLMFITYFWLYMLVSWPLLLWVMLLTRLGRKAEARSWMVAITRHWARTHLALIGAKVNVIGHENVPKDQAVVIISNHQSNLDIPILTHAINKAIAFISKAEVRFLPLFNIWMRYMGVVLMDRSNKRQSLMAIHEAVAKLGEGMSYVIFPEGTRTVDGSIGEFKVGSFKLATKAGVPILPVTINGSLRILKKNSFRINSAEIEVIISPVIQTAGKTGAELAELSRSVIEKNLGYGKT